MGGNPAENHPCGFKWAVEAKRNRNAKLISVDPRFTRTSSQADLFCRFAPAPTSPFSAASSTTPWQTTAWRRNIWSTTPTRPSSSRTDSSCRKTVCSPASMTRPRRYDKATWNYQEGGNETGKACAGRKSPSRRRPEHEAKPAVMPVSAPAKGSCGGCRTPLPPCLCRRMSPTICRCNIRAASINC